MKLVSPFQKKYIPVLIAAVLAVVCAVIGGFGGAFAFGLMAVLNWNQADQPLSNFYTHAYSAAAAICFAIAVFAVFSHTWPLVFTGFASGAFPLSIVLTRKGPS